MGRVEDPVFGDAGCGVPLAVAGEVFGAVLGEGFYDEVGGAVDDAGGEDGHPFRADIHQVGNRDAVSGQGYADAQQDYAGRRNDAH